MKSLIRITLAVLVTASAVNARDQIEIFGYFETQLMGAKPGNKYIQLHSNKLRFDFESRLAAKVTFKANFNFITWHGKTNWNILNFLPANLVENIPSELKAAYTIPFKDRHYLDNAFVRLSFDKFDLTLGKQQISSGTGYVWNPVDIFNTKDMLDPTYEQPGHNALRLDIPFNGSSSLSLIYSPGDNWNKSTKQLALKTKISRFDLTLSAAETRRFRHDYEQFSPDPQNPGFLLLTEKRQQLGLTTAGQLFGLGTWAEYAYNLLESSPNYYGWITGFDYTFKNQTYIMAEYYHNSSGETNKDKYTINSWMQLLAAERKTIARDQIYGMIRHPLTDLIHVNFSAVHVFSDGSTALIPALEYNIFENVDLTAYLNFYFGSKGSLYNLRLGNGGMIRIRAYF